MRRFPWRRRQSTRTLPIDVALGSAHTAEALWSFAPDQRPLPWTAPTVSPTPPTNRHEAVRRLVVDARCLQHPDFATRGIGRYTTALLRRLVDQGIELTLLVDDSLPDLVTTSLAPHRLTANIADPLWDGSTGFLDPAPMTHGPSRLDGAPAARRIAVVYDFIPLRSPDVYLGNTASRDDYLARLTRLTNFDSLWAISRSVAEDCNHYLGHVDVTSLPLPSAGRASTSPTEIDGVRRPFIFGALGADRRKNLPAAVCAVGGLAPDTFAGQLVILSHMPDAHRAELNELAHSIGLDPGRIVAVSDLDDSQVDWLYQNAEAVLMPSFDEGLSLPILEALEADCPVVASRIAPHEELIGSAGGLCNPRSASELAERLRVVLTDRQRSTTTQQAALTDRRSTDSDDWLTTLKPVP